MLRVRCDFCDSMILCLEPLTKIVFRVHVILRYLEGSLAIDGGSLGVPQDDIFPASIFVKTS